MLRKIYGEYKEFSYNLKMLLDKNKYAQQKENKLPYKMASAESKLINYNTGRNLIYQENKVHNLKIASKVFDRIVIRPGEIFSFCLLIRKAHKYGKFKDGLVFQNGVLTHTKGGGLCQMSNLLYYLFLQSPLDIIERHPHKVLSLPPTSKEELKAVDATIAGGYLDLKVQNNTLDTYQIIIKFDNDNIYGYLLCNTKPQYTYEIANEDLSYINENNKVFEQVKVIKITKENGKTIKKDMLYEERKEVLYALDK